MRTLLVALFLFFTVQSPNSLAMSCSKNSDCFSTEFCASGECLALPPGSGGGGGSGSCRTNSDCFSYEFCASGECIRNGNDGGGSGGGSSGSCRRNSDCFSYEFCASGECRRR